MFQIEESTISAISNSAPTFEQVFRVSGHPSASPVTTLAGTLIASLLISPHMFGLFSSAKVLARNIIHRTITTSVPVKVASPSPSVIRSTFHPVKQGELFADRYEVIDQLGSGLYSNVLLVCDIRYGFIPIQSLLSSCILSQSEPSCCYESFDI